MAKGKLIGLYLFAGGILLLIIYGLYQFVQEISGIDAIVLIGIGAILLGVIVLVISIILEQSSDMKESEYSGSNLSFFNKTC